MDLWQSFILGIIQGLTEFLPVSSSGHLVFFQHFFEFQGDHLAFDVVVHLGTLFSVCTIYFQLLKKIFVSISTDPLNSKKSNEWSLAARVVIASVPTAIIGLTLKDVFESLFESLWAVGWGFLFTGTLLYLTKRLKGQKAEPLRLDDLSEIKSMSYGQSFSIGLAQSFAITPGVSRSGSTIAMGQFLGLTKNQSALFSFMIALPAVAGASVLQLKRVGINELLNFEMGVGFLAAYVSGLLGLHFVLKTVQKGRLDFFSFYLWPLGLFCLAWSFYSS